MFGLRLKNTLWLLLLALMAGSINFFHHSVTIMEWSLVILFATAYCLVFFFSFGKPSRVTHSTLHHLVGFVVLVDAFPQDIYGEKRNKRQTLTTRKDRFHLS